MRGKLLALRRATGAPAEMSDVALLAACAVGEATALGAMFDRHRATVQRLLARLAGADQHCTDDLVQETFLQVQRSAARFAGRSSVKTWILGIAANLARHHRRTEARRRTASTEFITQPQRAPTTPHELACKHQFVAQLQHALAALPHEQREVFVMCDLEDVSGAEAAAVLGIREGTLWWRLSEARKALRAALEGMTP
ncbi:MAG: RNA polymerase sigma factor [Kofleriaceae bacterium]